MSETLKVRNWEKWQTYRRDRGQPPWIKVHREVMRNPDWVALTDAERGQLVGIWLLAADRDGVIPASPRLLAKLCFMDSEPDLEVFVSHGFIEPDVKAASERRQDDVTEAEAEAEAEAEREMRTREADLFSLLYTECGSGPLLPAESAYYHHVPSRVSHEELRESRLAYVARQTTAGLNVKHFGKWIAEGGYADPTLNGATHHDPDLWKD